MEIIPQAVVAATLATGQNAARVANVLQLLYTQECTIPFIARYRKEVTGGLDEVVIRDIQNAYEEYVELEKRRAYVLDQIQKMEKLTPELEKAIKAATNINVIEDIYAPFKSKKKTKAQMAKDYGLDPLAQLLLTSSESLEKIKATFGEDYIKTSEGKIPNFEEAVKAACDILVEEFAHNIEIKEKLRQNYWKDGKVVTAKRDDAEEVTEYTKFKDFFEFSEPVAQLKDKKASHRYLAMRRGMTLKVLKVEVEGDANFAYGMIQSNYFPKAEKLSQYELLKKCAKKAFDAYIHPSLDLEVKTELKKFADEAAIDVFGVNLKNLLLQPYLGSKAVLGIDPGVRTGCKVVIIDETGAFKGDHVVYPFAPKNDLQGSKVILEKMIELFNIKYIAIGNGTFGRETLQFCEEYVKQVKDGSVSATIVSESGASIYSASDIAREEFPDKDVTVRGAISIARRFQDPLAELVKIDPKSIGVGQYQHDVNQIKLKKSLEGVVEDCVNFVGVDINTASAPLLSYISGIGPSVAKNVVDFRAKNGKFKKREELLKVPRFSQKIFEQSAGFLRIYNGDNPLDSTFIHPERYQLLEKWVTDNQVKLIDLVNDQELKNKLAKDSKLKSEMGEMTFNDIVKSLQAPSQDPRTTFKSVEFDKTISEIKDLKSGQWYQGVVTNITMFGAFVDIGIKENGLLHISEISNEFVENALEKLKVGQELKVRVIDIDYDRKRISLSCKTDTPAAKVAKPERTGRDSNTSRPQASGGYHPGVQATQEAKSNPFAALKNFKVK
jgi:uncharacterized protein